MKGHRMPQFTRILLAGAAFAMIATTLLACGPRDASQSDTAPSKEVVRDYKAPHPLLAEASEAALDAGNEVEATLDGETKSLVESMGKAAATTAPVEPITVDYPLDGSVFPPEFLAPAFLWHDDANTDTWLVRIDFDEAEDITVAVPYARRPRGVIDQQARGESNELYLGTEYQNTAVSWTPSRPLWEIIKRRSSASPARVSFTGFASHDPARPLSSGEVVITTSTDPVGAPFFYRDVPLMPDVGAAGKIQPLSRGAIPLIGWRLRDVSRDDSKLVLKGMASCGNCHSFSLDGKTLGMDVDGPHGDKGTYAIKPVSKNMAIGYDDIITWNSFPEKPKDHKTIGFLSRMSPDGQYVVSTVNESVYVENFFNFRYLQVFFPTRGIIAYYSRATREMKALPGADDPEYVQCDPVWSPDGKWIVFARAKAFDPYRDGQKRATRANDPNEAQIQYNLYRIPFNGGRGGTPEPISGASDNGMSNTFPKVSPDGKWIVWVKCKNGQLMRPDGRLWIAPFDGGEAREMRCNTDNMNSWHSFSPNSRWMVFSSKKNRPYTQAFLTHIDEDGNDTPALLVPNCTADNRAVNLPEFLNAPYDALDTIDVPAVRHHDKLWAGKLALNKKEFETAITHLESALEDEPEFTAARVSLGQAFASMGQMDEAVKQFRLAQAANPTDFAANIQLGMALLESDRPDQAVRPLKKALSIVTYHETARRALITAYEELGRLDEAIVQGRRLLTEVPDDGDLERFVAGLLLRVGRGREAMHHLARAVQLLPENAKLATLFAWHLATHPDPEVRSGTKAVEIAEKAVELTQGQRPEPFDSLAAGLAESGRFDDAVKAGEQSLQLARTKAPAMTRDLQARIALYRKHRPYRAPVER